MRNHLHNETWARSNAINVCVNVPFAAQVTTTFARVRHAFAAFQLYSPCTRQT